MAQRTQQMNQCVLCTCRIVDLALYQFDQIRMQHQPVPLYRTAAGVCCHPGQQMGEVSRCLTAFRCASGTQKSQQSTLSLRDRIGRLTALQPGWHQQLDGLI